MTLLLVGAFLMLAVVAILADTYLAHGEHAQAAAHLRLADAHEQQRVTT